MEINNTHIHFKKLEKEQIKLKESTRKKIKKIREDINKIETKTQQKISMKLKTGSLK